MVLFESNYTLNNLPKAEWVIEAGEQCIQYELYKWWAKLWKGKIDLQFSNEGIIRNYAVLESQPSELNAKCTFVKVNDQVVCMLQPIGRHSNHSKMEFVVKYASGIYNNRDRISNVTNAHNILYNIQHRSQLGKSGKGKPHEIDGFTREQQGLFEETEFILLVDGDFLAEKLLNTWREREDKPKITFLAEHIINYAKNPIKKDVHEIEVHEKEPKHSPCWAQCTLLKINTVLVALIYNSGIHGDHAKLKSEIRNWCPTAKRMITSEDLPRMLGENGVSELMKPFGDILLKQVSMPQIPSDALPKLSVPSLEGLSKINLKPAPRNIPPSSAIASENMPAEVSNELPHPLMPQIQHKPADPIIPDLISFDENDPKPHVAPKSEQASKDDPKDVQVADEDSDEEGNPFLCCISREEMTEPVMSPRGHSYQKDRIEEWVKLKGTSPMTREPLTLADLKPNINLRDAIERAKRKKAKSAPKT